jgi:1,4-dihydroxy-6-naphthoate synthase
LNELVGDGALDLSKVSYFAALCHASKYAMLASGSALGYGVGPLLLARPGAQPLAPESKVLAPGVHTTAHLLLRLFYPAARAISQTVFSEIMPALRRGDADYGAVIHEGRFTYREHGLELVQDLGALWESRYRLPLPLGGIVGRRDLGDELLSTVSDIIADSLLYAWSHKEETFPTMARYAQELSPDVVWSHVDLYVNEWTRTLGPSGVEAVRALESAARNAGVLSADVPALDIVGEVA